MLDTLTPTLDTSLPAYDEPAVVRAAAAGDVAAYEQLYRRHAPRLFAVVWRLCGGQRARAEDALQEAFLQAWKALPAFRMDSSIATWLHRLAVNAALMELRARSNQAHDSLDDADLDLPQMHVHDRCAGTERDLERVLATLPPRARAVWYCMTSKAGNTVRSPNSCRWRSAVRRHSCIEHAACCARAWET